MFYSTSNTPGVARLNFMPLRPNEQAHPALDQIPRLFVLVRMAWENRTTTESELGHQRLFAVNQRLPLNAWQSLNEIRITLFAEHAQ